MNEKVTMIPLKGITRNTSKAASQDGEMDELINLRHKYGSLRPISPKKVIATNIEYTSLFVHRNAGFAHLLGVKDGQLFYIANMIDDEIDQPVQPEFETGVTYHLNDLVSLNGSNYKNINGTYQYVEKELGETFLFGKVVYKSYLNVGIYYTESLGDFSDSPVFVQAINKNYTFITSVEKANYAFYAVTKLQKDGMDTWDMPTIDELYYAIQNRASLGGLPDGVYVSKSTYDSFYFKGIMLFENDLTFVQVSPQQECRALPVLRTISDYLPGNFWIESTALPEPQFICDITGAIHTSQINNIVNIIDESGIKYALWYNGSYRNISTNFDGNQQSNSLSPEGMIEIRGNGIFVEDIPNDYYYGNGFWYKYPMPDNTGDIDVNVARSLIYKAISKSKELGYSIGFRLACYAIKLYDGTYILHSNPKLIGQSFDRTTRYSIGAFDYLSSPTTTAIDFVGANRAMTDNSENFKMRFKGSAMDEIVWPNVNTYYYESGAIVETQVSVTYQQLQYRIFNHIDENLKPLIKSVCLFITDEVLQYDIEHDFVKTSLGKSIPFAKSNSVLIEELSQLKSFYNVKEIEFDDFNTTDLNAWINIDMKDTMLNLASLEVLDIDNFTHHSFYPGTEYVYNSKLHIANYGVSLSRGFPLGYLQCPHTQNTSDVSIDKFQPTKKILYPGQPVTSSWWIKTDIKTDTGESSVVRYFTGTFYSFDLDPVISYPDSRAVKMTILQMHNISGDGIYVKQMEIKLTQSLYFNFAFFINSDLKPYGSHSSTFILDNSALFVLPQEVLRTLIYPNSMKVSLPVNPFIFPAENTYTVGSREIRGLCANTIALSTGQFGEFPLYVFCADGIYAMYLGQGLVDYSTSKPVSRDVLTGDIKPIDGGIAFITDRGLMVISGSTVNELSEPLRGEIYNQSDFMDIELCMDSDKFVSLSDKLSTDEFLSEIGTGKLGYDYKEKEIYIFCNNYSWIFSKGIWTKSTHTAEEIIPDYPFEYTLRYGKIYSINKEIDMPSDALLITRPIKIGGQGFKESYRVIMRSLLSVNSDKYVGFYVLGSNDCFNWKLLGGQEIREIDRNIGALTERKDVRFIRIVLSGSFKPETTLDYIEYMSKYKLNTKIR